MTFWRNSCRHHTNGFFFVLGFYIRTSALLEAEHHLTRKKLHPYLLTLNAYCYLRKARKERATLALHRIQSFKKYHNCKKVILKLRTLVLMSHRVGVIKAWLTRQKKVKLATVIAAWGVALVRKTAVKHVTVNTLPLGGRLPPSLLWIVQYFGPLPFFFLVFG